MVPPSYTVITNNIVADHRMTIDDRSRKPPQTRSIRDNTRFISANDMIPMTHLHLDHQSAEKVHSAIAWFTILVNWVTIHSRIYQNGKRLYVI